MGEDGSLTWDQEDTSLPGTHFWMEQHQGGVAFQSASKTYLSIDGTGSVDWNAITITDAALFNIEHMIQTGDIRFVSIMAAFRNLTTLCLMFKMVRNTRLVECFFIVEHGKLAKGPTKFFFW